MSAQLPPAARCAELRTLALHISSEIIGLASLYESLQTPNEALSTRRKVDPNELYTSKSSARQDSLVSSATATCEEGDTRSCTAGDDSLAQALSAAGLVRSQLEALKHPHSSESNLNGHEQNQKPHTKQLHANNHLNQPEPHAKNERSRLGSSVEAQNTVQTMNYEHEGSTNQCRFCSSSDGVIVNTCQCTTSLGFAHPICLQRFRADLGWPSECSFCHSLYSTDCRIALSVIGGNRTKLDAANTMETTNSPVQKAPDRLSACRELLETSLTRLTLVVDRRKMVS